MNTRQLISGLSRPEAYPEPVPDVEVRQTHISAVFLAGRHAYKVKKPVGLGFLDFTTLDKRRHFCEEEVRVNRRLAPGVYLGVVPVVRDGAGLRFEGPGEPVEWAVKMARLPDEASLLSRLERGLLDARTLTALAQRLAAFHAEAQGGPHAAIFARFGAVAANARENLDQAAAQVGTTLSPALLSRLREVLESELDHLHGLIEARADRGVARDTHGDLRLEHVYQLDDLVIIDAIEFNDRYRLADPVADVAFLVMDLASRQRADLARVFADAYFDAAHDPEGRELLAFYAAYRAMVRAKVRGLKAAESEVPYAQRVAAQRGARAGWLLALSLLETPARVPCLALTAGLPGSGKSTLAHGLAQHAGFTVLRSDVVRKELAGHSGAIYTPEWDDRTLVECLHRAEKVLDDGGRVLVDATFRDESRRLDFLRAANQSGVPFVMFLCRADPEVTRTRLDGRRGDASDADWSVYRLLAKQWQEPGPLIRPRTCEVPTGGEREAALDVALRGLDEQLAEQGVREVGVSAPSG
jgi:aminoglycoside phosphotransferase family enzyme/predicted kinase